MRRAEEEAETWKKKAEEEKAKALAAQIALVSNSSYDAQVKLDCCSFCRMSRGRLRFLNESNRA